MQSQNNLGTTIERGIIGSQESSSKSEFRKSANKQVITPNKVTY